MPRTPEILTNLDPPWLSVEPIRVGPVASTLRTPDRYVVGQFGQLERQLRIDIYFDPNEYNFRVAAEEWNHLVVIAAGESLYLVDQNDSKTARHALSGYFCSFAATADQLVVASAEQILSISRTGQLMWRSERLGIDGVVIHGIADDIIQGAGEWDPPGGWREFALSCQSGKRVR